MKLLKINIYFYQKPANRVEMSTAETISHFQPLITSVLYELTSFSCYLWKHWNRTNECKLPGYVLVVYGGRNTWN